MIDYNQTTIKGKFHVEGIGLHSGTVARLVVRPAQVNTGIVFIRTDIDNIHEAKILAKYDNVADTTLCSSLVNEYGHKVSTVEHLLAAFVGMGIDNAEVDIDGDEVPIMDGSALPFVEFINDVGVCALEASRKMLKIIKPIRIVDGDKFCELLPDTKRVFEAEIEFENSIIGRESTCFTLEEDCFSSDIALARTFCFLKDVEYMQQAGLARGGSLDNAIVVSDDKILNLEGLRCQGEFVRHKLLDAIGDLSLSSFQIIGRYRGFKSGHEMHHRLLCELFMNEGSFEIIDAKEYYSVR